VKLASPEPVVDLFNAANQSGENLAQVNLPALEADAVARLSSGFSIA
jgi:hypothetical protein